MLIEIIFFLFFGIFAGTITGLTPGIHINLISTIIISSFLNINPIYLTTFIVSMAITHTFLDFIPSTFLGCPDSDTELSILPSHNMLKNRRGFEAINLANKGSLIAIFLFALILIPSFFFLKKIYEITNHLIPYFLIFIILIMIFTEKQKINALFVIILTGTLGILTNSIELKEPLLPLLTGLFGTSNIIISLKQKTKIPEQIISYSKQEIKKPIIASLLSAPLCSFLPGVGSGQAAIIGNSLIKNNEKQFLILIGIINTLIMSFSFISLYLIKKTRTGAALAIGEIIPYLELKHILLIIVIIATTGIISYNLTNFIGKIIALKVHKIKYKYLSYITLIIIIIITLFISKLNGLFLLIISTITGIYCIKLKVKRTNMMGCLIVPTIFWLI